MYARWLLRHNPPSQHAGIHTGADPNPACHATPTILAAPEASEPTRASSSSPMWAPLVAALPAPCPNPNPAPTPTPPGRHSSPAPSLAWRTAVPRASRPFLKAPPPSPTSGLRPSPGPLPPLPLPAPPPRPRRPWRLGRWSATTLWWALSTRPRVRPSALRASSWTASLAPSCRLVGELLAVEVVAAVAVVVVVGCRAGQGRKRSLGHGACSRHIHPQLHGDTLSHPTPHPRAPTHLRRTPPPCCPPPPALPPLLFPPGPEAG